MASVFHLYYVVPTQQAYTSDRSLVNSGNCPHLRFTGKYLIFLHLLNSETTDEDGNFTDIYTGYDSAISASAAVDNNNNWTDGGKLNAALNAGTSYSIIALNSFSPHRNKSSMQKKVFRMNPVVALPAALLANSVPAVPTVPSVKCTKLSVLSVASRLRFLSVPVAIVRFIAATATPKTACNKNNPAGRRGFFYYMLFAIR